MPVSSPETPVVREQISVWIVEDKDDYRNSVCDLINSRKDMQCTRAFGSCEDALAVLNSDFAPEVVLMDIGLPGIDGIEGVRRLKMISPATHVIMLTIHEDNDRVFNAICVGATGYLLKMAPAAKIFEAILAVSSGGAAMTPQIARRVMNVFAQLHAPRWDYQLTKRELEILQHLVDGEKKTEIAEALYLSYHTIDTHIRSIYTKLHVNSRSDAVVKALRERLINP